MDRNTRVYVVVSLGVSVLAMSCAHHARAAAVPAANEEPALEPVADYVGIYKYSFEESRFMPCEHDLEARAWWVVPLDAAMKSRDSLTEMGQASTGRSFFVRLRGAISSRPGLAGHMGRYARYFIVTEIVQWAPSTGTECPASLPSGTRANPGTTRQPLRSLPDSRGIAPPR